MSKRRLTERKKKLLQAEVPNSAPIASRGHRRMKPKPGGRNGPVVIIKAKDAIV